MNAERRKKLHPNKFKKTEEKPKKVKK